MLLERNGGATSECLSQFTSIFQSLEFYSIVKKFYHGLLDANQERKRDSDEQT